MEVGHPVSPFAASPPPPPSLPKPNLSPFYYGVVVIASTAVLLALYNLIVVGWCRHHRPSRQRPNQSLGSTSRSFENSDSNLISTFKYRKEEVHEQVSDNECAVCLSVFEDGEDIRQLPRCKHSFHAPCIDMWLYSHSDCPLCRAIVGPPVSHRLAFLEEENFRDGSPDSSSSSV